MKLADYGVSVINVSGLPFGPFARLFQQDNLAIPCSLLTDGDPRLTDEEESLLKKNEMSKEEVYRIEYPSQNQRLRASATADKLQGMESGELKVFLADKTFEYDLALAGNAELMAQVYCESHPVVGKRMLSQMQTVQNANEKAAIFFYEFDPKEKGRFAQALAAHLEDTSIHFDVPPYLLRTARSTWSAPTASTLRWCSK